MTQSNEEDIDWSTFDPAGHPNWVLVDLYTLTPELASTRSQPDFRGVLVIVIVSNHLVVVIVLSPLHEDVQCLGLREWRYLSFILTISALVGLNNTSTISF